LLVIFRFPFGVILRDVIRRLVGPNGFDYNSGPINFPGMKRLVPMMGFNFEREIAEMKEDFGHRTEDTMRQAAGSIWGKFSFVQSQTQSAKFLPLAPSLRPPTNYNGCGSVHFPPNGVADYDWENSSTVGTYCDEYTQYPRLPMHPHTRPISSVEWGGNGDGYLTWWFERIPRNPGASDGVLNNWWPYIVDPNNVGSNYR
ncbi:MAG: hypothetical protein WCP97_09660, partial [bacterium]